MLAERADGTAVCGSLGQSAVLEVATGNVQATIALNAFVVVRPEVYRTATASRLAGFTVVELTVR